MLAAHWMFAPALAQTVGLHVAVETRAGRVDEASRWALDGDTWLLDAAATVRPLFSTPAGNLEFHAELDVTTAAGDSLAFADTGLTGGLPPPRDVFDFFTVWSSGERHRHTARLDRLAVAWTPSWGTATAGRHAVTWGGGLVFNPFDLFNPFAPGDVIRDYKVGADMIHVDVPLSDGGLQVLAVGRRAVDTGDIAARASSLAVLWQKHLGAGEVGLMGAWHYDEPVIGASVSGLLGAAAWRVDGTWVRVRPPGLDVTEDYLAAVANVQYSWVWGGRNVFGFLEYHHNGLGHSDYPAALVDPFLLTQISRQNVFLLGRDYAAASLQVEVHPLVHAFVSVIVNLRDPSALVQPRVTWSATQRMQILFGLDIPLGSRGTEFGGIELGEPAGTTRVPISGYVRATWDW